MIKLENVNFSIESDNCSNSNLDNSQNQNNQVSQFHDAGYDSYIGGVCFLALQSIYSNNDDELKNFFWLDRKFRNCLYNGFSYDIPYFHPIEDLPISRPNVLYVRFQKKNQNPKEFFRSGGDLSIGQLDERSVLIAVKKENFKKFIGKYKSCSDYQICRYSEYANNKKSRLNQQIEKLALLYNEIKSVPHFEVEKLKSLTAHVKSISRVVKGKDKTGDVLRNRTLELLELKIATNKKENHPDNDRYLNRFKKPVFEMKKVIEQKFKTTQPKQLIRIEFVRIGRFRIKTNHLNVIVSIISLSLFMYLIVNYLKAYL